MALMKQCPQFYTCSAPLCPLDPRYPDRPAFKGDDRCTSRKSTRLRITEEAEAKGIATVGGLEYRGLTVKEFTSEERSRRMKARWEALPEDEKQERLRTLSQGRSELKRKRDNHQCLEDRAAK